MSSVQRMDIYVVDKKKIKWSDTLVSLIGWWAKIWLLKLRQAKILIVIWFGTKICQYPIIGMPNP
jgi:hypothetical protein